MLWIGFVGIKSGAGRALPSDVLAVICVSVFVPLAIGITLDRYEHGSTKNNFTFCSLVDRNAANPMIATANTGAQATTSDWQRINPRGLTSNAIRSLYKSRLFKLKTQALEGRLRHFRLKNAVLISI